MTTVESIKPDPDNQEFQKALELIRNTNISFFLTGKAGTGKSTFLRYVTQNIDKNFVVIAPTGVAAMNIGGTTIHSMFQFPFRFILPNDEEIRRFGKDSYRGQLLRNVDTIIIDEISMVRVDLIDAIDECMRLNCGNSLLPFGGKQVVFVGDVFQLEPVNLKPEEADVMQEVYDEKHLFFFKAKVFEKFELPTIELRKAYRQQEGHFLSILDNIRVNEPTTENIQELNRRQVNPRELENKEFIITLCTTNKSAETVNQSRLVQLPNQEFSYIAEIDKEFEESKYPTDRRLRLKKDARVIFIKNDSENKWVNGTIGQVVDLSEKEIKVRLKNGEIYSVPKVKWENTRYKFDRRTRKIEKEVVGSFTQFPLKLAWAITIHKSQGMTFEEIIVDFGTGAFAGGQTYVALSRCVKLDGIYLKNSLQRRYIFVSPEVKRFATTFNDFTHINNLESEENELDFFKRYGLTENIGQYHLKQSLDHLQSRNFKKAYDNFIKAYELISDDDFVLDLFDKGEFLWILHYTGDTNCKPQELALLKAFILYFLNHFDLCYECALQCLKGRRNKPELAYYFAGKSNMRMNRLKMAKEDFEEAQLINKHPRNLYQYSLALGGLGLKHAEFLVDAYLKNSSSLAVYQDIVSYIENAKILLTHENTELINLFLNPNRVKEFLISITKQPIFIFENGQKMTSKEIFEDFEDIVSNNREIIIKAN